MTLREMNTNKGNFIGHFYVSFVFVVVVDVGTIYVVVGDGGT